MMSPQIESLAELEAQLALSRGWLFLHTRAVQTAVADEGNTPESPPPRPVAAPLRREELSANAFEAARRDVEDRLPVTLLRCVVPASASRCSPWFGLDPLIHAFFRGKRIESIRAPERPVAIIEWVEMLDSLHSPNPPRVLLDPPGDA